MSRGLGDVYKRQIKDCDVLNQYVKITIDLSAYQSDRMRVAFHAYDTNDVGLSYWWQIDDVEIYSAPSETMVEGYAVYRNGIKLGETPDVTFTDAEPLAGENIYTVRVIGRFGETSDSEAAVLMYDPSGVETVGMIPDVTVGTAQGRVVVQSSVPLEQVRLVTVGGMQAALAYPKGNVCIFDVSGMSRGLYLVVCETEGDGTPVVRKVILK